MNDRFKFRVWDKPLEKYMEFKEFRFMNVEFTFNPITKEAEIEYDKERYIVEQCTGLKDKNGKLIYEGDIMEHRIYLGNPELYVVKWSESVNGWVYQDARNSLKTSYILTEFTDSIIGNIHENQELLKESK